MEHKCAQAKHQGGTAMANQKQPERSFQELYRDDPERADALVWGRRGALQGAALAAMGTALGAAIPFGRNMPSGLVPAALAQGATQPQFLQMPGKAPEAADDPCDRQA
jgi:sulfite oxidase